MPVPTALQPVRSGLAARRPAGREPRAVAPLNRPANGWPAPQYAEPLIPYWVVGLFAVLVLALVVPGQSHRQAAAVFSAPPGACGPHWQVARGQDGSYRAQTHGLLTTSLLPACTFVLPAGTSRLIVHATGDAITVLSGGTSRYLPASGWWALPLLMGERQVTVVPVARGGDVILDLIPE